MQSQQSLRVLPQLIRALAFLQMIEEALRLYVGTAEELIAAARPYGVPFKVDKKIIESAALGKLISMFEKLNSNEALHSRLRALPKHRNHIAHAAFMRAVQRARDESVDLEYARSHAQSVGDEAERLVWILHQELGSLLQVFPDSPAAKCGGA